MSLLAVWGRTPLVYILNNKSAAVASEVQAEPNRYFAQLCFFRWHTRVSYMRPRSGSTPQLYFRPMMCIKVQCMCLSPRVKKIILWYTNLWYYSSLLTRHAWDCNDQLHDCTLRIQFVTKGLHDQNNPIYKRFPLSLQGPAAPPCQSFVVAYVYLWPSTLLESLSLGEF